MADELVDFFIAEDILDVGFDVEEIEGVHRRSSLELQGVDAKFRMFFERMLERAKAADTPLLVREQQELLATLRHPGFGRIARNSQNEPFGFVSVSSRGGLYTFSPELAGLTDPHYGDMTVGQLPRRQPRLHSLLLRISPDVVRYRSRHRRCASDLAPISTCASGDRRSTNWQSAGHSRLARHCIAGCHTWPFRTFVLSQLEASLNDATRPQLHRS